MDQLQWIAEIKRLVGKANVEQALDRMVEELEKAGSDLAEEAIKVQSQFQKTQRDESRGSISFENAKLSYSQINDQIFNLLDDVERQAKAAASPTAPKKRLALWAGGSALVLAIVSFLIFNKKEEPLPPPVIVDTNCPSFDSEAAFKVLVFPFFPLGGQLTATHVSVIDRLATLSDNFKIKSSIERYKLDFEGADAQDEYPSTPTQASVFAGNCGAQLVIFGTTDEQKSGNIITTTKYKFLNLGEQFALTELKITEGSALDTITSITSIATNGAITGNIETSIKILFGLIANNSGHAEAAIAELENIQNVDSANTILLGMTLADSYLATNQPDKALASYDKVLEQHPNYGFALNNRAALNYQKSDYAASIKDYDALVKLKQVKKEGEKEADARIARGMVHLKTQALDKAEQDFQNAQKLAPEDNRIQQLMPQVIEMKRSKLELKQKAEAIIQRSPKNAPALAEKASADKALGNHAEAVSAAKAAYKNDSQDPRVISILLEEAAKTNNTREFQRIMKRANQLRIQPSELIENAPTLKQRLQ